MEGWCPVHACRVWLKEQLQTGFSNSKTLQAHGAPTLLGRTGCGSRPSLCWRLPSMSCSRCTRGAGCGPASGYPCAREYSCDRERKRQKASGQFIPTPFSPRELLYATQLFIPMVTRPVFCWDHLLSSRVAFCTLPHYVQASLTLFIKQLLQK